MDEVGATPEEYPKAYESVYAAEGSDWFWWFGDDFVLPQGVDWTFDMLFREHLKNVYRSLGEEPPDFLDDPIVRQQMLWTKDEPVRTMEPGQLLRIMSGAPGTVRWSVDRWRTSATRTLEPAGDVMANLSGYSTMLGPFDESTWGVEFAFVEEKGPGTHTVRVVRPRGDGQ